MCFSALAGRPDNSSVFECEQDREKKTRIVGVLGKFSEYLENNIHNGRARTRHGVSMSQSHLICAERSLNSLGYDRSIDRLVLHLVSSKACNPADYPSWGEDYEHLH